MSLLMECSIRALLLAGAVAAVMGGMGIANARARHRAWWGVLTAMLLLPVFCWWGPKATFRVLPAREDAPAMRWAPSEALPPKASYPPSAPRAAYAVPNPVLAPERSRPDLLPIIYLLVTGLFLIRLLAGAVRAAAVARRAQPERGFRSSPEVACPVTVGWWKPVVLVPSFWAAWPRAELDAVLAHEREHARRRDPLVQSLAALNRSIFWFHPLAWWLERKLAALSEEACDVAVVESGCDARDYSEYLIHQARAVERAGARMLPAGTGIGGGGVSWRVQRLLEGSPAPCRLRALLSAGLIGFAIAVFAACRLERVDKAAPGQPSMHELAMRLADSNIRYQEREGATAERARSLGPEAARQLLSALKQQPEDAYTFQTLVRHYELEADVKRLDALRLWYIEHEPGGTLWPGNIDPRLDPAGYQNGKALWLANLKRPRAAAELYRRAADFLEGGDKALVERVLEAGRKAYPEDKAWPMAFGRHYARVLLGAAGVADYNTVRSVNLREADSAYAQRVREQLAGSRDAAVLAQTALWLLAWGERLGQQKAAPEVRPLAQMCLARALALDPDEGIVQSVKLRLDQIENTRRFERLRKLPPAQLAASPAGDRMLVDLYEMRLVAGRQNFADAKSKARELLDLAAHNPKDALYGEAIFAANMVLGKAAMRNGDAGSAARHLLAAAETPGSEEVQRGEFDMNLPRALVDRGQRRAVIDFFQRMAPKTARSKQFQDWAAELANGINPDLLPVFFAPECSNDPC